ncbi:Fic family protein [Algoriphagus aquimarinus]|uniref:Fic family protein n=1 Tax=Algoriphagus aquimarinus TaxID=237018 RepID=UPI00373FCD16
MLRTLVYCIKPKSKADILSNLGLKNTTNNFQRAIGPALELEWLEMTNPESPNSLEQRYVITEEGKRVVKTI